MQLPGLNTPQFDWVRTRLHKHPQPVPPIYQPEVAARAIAYAAEHPRRELWVGLPTVYTILGEKFASGLMDRYLGRTNEQGAAGRRSRSTRPRAATTCSRRRPATLARTGCSTTRRTSAARSCG